MNDITDLSAERPGNCEIPSALFLGAVTRVHREPTVTDRHNCTVSAWES